MIEIQEINTPTLELPVLASSAYVTLSTNEAMDYVIIYNSSIQDVFVVAGDTAAPTAAFPASETSSVAGKVIPAGAKETYKMKYTYGYIAMIGKAADASGNVYFSFGKGI